MPFGFRDGDVVKNTSSGVFRTSLAIGTVAGGVEGVHVLWNNGSLPESILYGMFTFLGVGQVSGWLMLAGLFWLENKGRIRLE